MTSQVSAGHIATRLTKHQPCSKELHQGIATYKRSMATGTTIPLNFLLRINQLT
jgi:hypothetical protein